MATGCTPKDPFPSQQHYPSSAINLPFIAPRSELCGSNSIEMVASYWQSSKHFFPKLSIEELDARTLIPAKGGTLQIELVTAARADGLIAYPMKPTFEALFAELEAHHPVVVLVNRSFSWHPMWHYVPVIGYDEKKRSIITHFADQPNESVPLGTFAALWQRSENWGVVLLPPGEIPASVPLKTFLRAVYEFEKTGEGTEAIKTYKSALLRYSDNTDILFALANSEMKNSQLLDAEKHYRQILALNPSHSLALNNLAILLSRNGKFHEGLELLNKVVSDDPKILSLVKSSHEEISKGCIPYIIDK